MVQDLRLSGREFQRHGKAEEKDLSPHRSVETWVQLNGHLFFMSTMTIKKTVETNNNEYNNER